MTADIEGLLGAEGKKLLEHKCTTIRKESIHLPGPDYVDRIYALSDRPTPVLRSLQQLLEHGRLAATGYLSILPVDQGIEHSAGASFAPISTNRSRSTASSARRRREWRCSRGSIRRRR